MIFSRATEYAIRGLSELAGRTRGGTFMLDDLIAGANLPRDFLAKIFQRLVKAGILHSCKGRGGGFSLVRPPHEVTLMHIMEAIEGPQPVDICAVGMGRCSDTMPCPQHHLYKPIRLRLKEYLTTTTLADLAASLKSKAQLQNVQLEQYEIDSPPPDYLLDLTPDEPSAVDSTESPGADDKVE
jgi:Rrf2 family iron-sulfur cluster assembly transcriptional regulator